jgi:hypothetical protein
VLEAELYRLKGELTLQQLSVASSQLSVPNPQSLPPKAKPKRIVAKLLRSPAGSRRNHGSYGRR